MFPAGAHINKLAREKFELHPEESPRFVEQVLAKANHVSESANDSATCTYSEGRAMKYLAKKDLGTGVMFTLLLVACVGFGIFFITMPDPTVVGGTILMLTGILWLWFWFGTTYEITSSHVIVRLGPIRWRIKMDEIVEAVPTSSVWLMLGGSHARFALSADAIMIKYRKKNGRKWLGFIEPAVLISPQDKTEFLQELAEGSTNIEQSDDGSV